MTDVQAAIQAAAEEMVASGAETGLQIAVHRHGHVVADVVSGVADPETGAGVRPGTLFYAASAAKGIAASLAHVLAERGDLDYDMRVAEVWPEFGSRGKDRVTLRHVLLHTAGLPGLPSQTTIEQLCDWDHMCAVLAAQEPWWEPGTRFPVSWAFGYSSDRPGGVPSRRGSTFGMVGANGSAANAHVDSGLAVAVMRNGPAQTGLAAVTRIDQLIA